MKDEHKNRVQLIDELVRMRQRVAELEAADTERKRAEEETQKALQLNALLLDSIPHPAMLIRPDRTVIAANNIALEMGAKIGEPCWREWGKSQFVRGGETKCWFCMADEAMDEDEGKQCEVEAFEQLWDTWWVPVGGEVYLHYATDITWRKRAEEALRESEERFRVMFENSHDLLTVSDQNGNTLWANLAWKETFGYTPETQGDPIEKIHPDDRARVLEAWQSMDDDESAFTNVEYRYWTTIGEYVNLEVTARRHLVAGQPLLYVVAHDITEHKQAEEALRESEAKFRSVVQSAIDAIISVDSRGNIVFCNRSVRGTFGYTED